MDNKLLIGIIGALAGGTFTMIASYLSAKYRMKEIEYKILHRSAMGRLASARSKLNDIYIPINKKVETLDGAFEQYWKSKSQDDQNSFISAFEELTATYDSIKNSGETLFLVSEIHDEIDYLITLIHESQSASKVSSVIITKVEMIGLRAVSKKVYSQWTALFFYFGYVLLGNIRGLIKFSGAAYFLDTAIRTYSAPLASEDFRSEFSTSISIIRSRSKEIALSEITVDTQPAVGVQS